MNIYILLTYIVIMIGVDFMEKDFNNTMPPYMDYSMMQQMR